jgi:hypothetical protein
LGTGIVNGKAFGPDCPDCMGTGTESSRASPEPTSYHIGSEEKIALMRQRYLSNQQLFSPSDSKVFSHPDKPPIRSLT